MKIVSSVDVCLQGRDLAPGVNASHAVTCTRSVACKLRLRNSEMSVPMHRHVGEPPGGFVPDSPERDLVPPASGSPEQLFAALYHELHALAQRRLRGLPFGCTLSTTTLLHEAYLSLANNQDLSFPDRPRFLSYASRAMRGLIIDYARRRSATKRGGEFQLVPLDGVDVPGGSAIEDLAGLGTALEELAKLDPALAELVDLHFFCGLPFVEIAALRGVSERTLQRDWRKARLILHHQLRH